MNWLTAKVAQGIAAALLVLCAALGVRLWVVSHQLATAKATTDAAQSARDAAITERDAWKGQSDGCAAANAAYDAILRDINAEQARRDAAAAEAAKRAAAALGAAQADAARARRDLAGFQRRFDTRGGNCEQALQAMQAACPALEHY